MAFYWRPRKKKSFSGNWVFLINSNSDRESTPRSTLLRLLSSHQTTAKKRTHWKIKFNSHHTNRKERKKSNAKKKKKEGGRIEGRSQVQRSEEEWEGVHGKYHDWWKQTIPWHIWHTQGSCSSVWSCCHPSRTSNIQTELSWSSS